MVSMGISYFNYSSLNWFLTESSNSNYLGSKFTLILASSRFFRAIFCFFTSSAMSIILSLAWMSLFYFLKQGSLHGRIVDGYHRLLN